MVLALENLHEAELTLGVTDTRPARARGRRHSLWRLAVPGAPNTVLCMLVLVEHVDRRPRDCMAPVVCFDCILIRLSSCAHALRRTPVI